MLRPYGEGCEISRTLGVSPGHAGESRDPFEPYRTGTS